MKPLKIANADQQSVHILAWRISAKGKSADVDLYDIIGEDFFGDGIKAADFVRDLRALDVDQINLHVNSPGGYVDDALAMFNALQQHPANVDAFVEGVAASAASFVIMAADQVTIAEHARIMIHDAQAILMILERVNAAEVDDLIGRLEATRNILDEESDNIAGIYAERTNTSAAEWRRRMQANGRHGTSYRGQAAVDVGLADVVAKAPQRKMDDLDPERVAALADDDDEPQDDPDEPFDFSGLEPLGEAAGYQEPAPSLEGLLTKHPINVGGSK